MTPDLACIFAIFPAFSQERVAARTSAVIPDSPNGGSGVDLAVFLAFGRTPPNRLLLSAKLSTPHVGAGAGRGRSSAISRKISWNICLGTATSAIWNAT
jgi:hypothetical protein